MEERKDMVESSFGRSHWGGEKLRVEKVALRGHVEKDKSGEEFGQKLRKGIWKTWDSSTIGSD